MIEALTWRARVRALRVRRWATCATSNWVWSRVACLGIDVLRRTAPESNIVNTQKGRADYLVDAYACRKRPCTADVAKFFKRKDVIGLVAQQEVFTWNWRTLPKAVVLDSFSELTDQQFGPKDKRTFSFYTNYSDLRHSPELAQKYSNFGLLECKLFESAYRELFLQLRRNAPRVPIVFLHFPKKLERREQFRLRHDYIRAAVARLSLEFHPFLDLSAPEDCVDAPRGSDRDAFPYHYDDKTYDWYVAEIKKSRIKL